MNRNRVGAVTATVVSAGWLALGAPMLTAAASANTPLGWAEVESVPVLHWLLLFGVPIVAFVVITLMVMGPSWASGERRAETGGGEIEAWFGGPNRSSDEIEAGGESAPADRGGAGGRW